VSYEYVAKRLFWSATERRTVEGLHSASILLAHEGQGDNIFTVTSTGAKLQEPQICNTAEHNAANAGSSITEGLLHGKVWLVNKLLSQVVSPTGG
jgi:hypothetical protein